MKKQVFFDSVQNGDNHFSSPLSLESGFYDGRGAILKLDGGMSIMQDNITLKNFVIHGNISVIGANFTIVDCTVRASGTAILSCGEGFIAKNNKIEGAKTAIALEGGAYNSLIAQNEADGDITVTDAFNSSVLLNNAENILMRGNTNAYAAFNSLRGSLSLTDNDFLIADGNICSETVNENNKNHNGDNVTDIHERAEWGALPKNQPHTNRDLFVGMERQTYVRDSALEEALSLDKYLPRMAAENDVVIIPPGAYTADEICVLGNECSNTKIYAYGVYLEKTCKSSVLELRSANNMEIYGLTVGYTLQSCGQAHVLRQISDLEYLIIGSAGKSEDFSKTNTELFSQGAELVPQSGLYTTRMLGKFDITKNTDGTMSFKFLEKMFDETMIPGDMLICRTKGPNLQTLIVADSDNVFFCDFTLYGYASALAVLGAGTSNNVRFLRHHNLPHSGNIINKATFDRYRALETEYGVDLHISIDSQGRYRGCPAMAGSVDAFHVMGTKKGFDVTSSMLEQMVDDGSNQRCASSRLHSLTDNGDGTATFVYKDNLAEFYFNYAHGSGVSRCVTFKKDDLIFAYNTKGMLVCETRALSDSRELEPIAFEIEGKKFTAKCYEITVASADVDFSALEGFDLSDNHYKMDQKILVDNLSRNSVGYTFDNVTVRNTRSRGILFKTRNVTAKHCTFKNLAHTGLLLSIEPIWGESTVGCNATVKNCIIDHVGFINNYNYYMPLTPISIMGFGETVSENTLLYKNIVIEGNRFKNNAHDYFINVNSAQDVKIINNIFEPGAHEHQEYAQKVINIDTAMNIEISGNTYSKYLKDIKDGITAKNYKNVYGTDITLEDDIK